MEDLIKEGFKLIGVANVPNHNSFMDTLSKHGLRRWRAAYGHRPAVLDEAWRQIKSEARKRNMQLKHFFWAMHFMKTYQSEDNLSNTMNTTPKTFREKAKTIIKLLKREMPGVVSQPFFILTSILAPSNVHSNLKQILWRNRNAECDRREIFKISVDCVDFPMEEPGGKSKSRKKETPIIFKRLKNGKLSLVDPKWYSKKFNGAGLKWEIGVALFSDHIVWVRGPYPCGEYGHDLIIFRETGGLKEALVDAREMAIGDGTYKDFTISQKGDGNYEWRHAKNRFRARQESVNGRIKIFNCFNVRWRHSHELHKSAMHAALYLTQVSMDYDSLMAPVEKV